MLYDYLCLTRPRVLSLLLLTTLVGMVLAEEGFPSPARVFWTLAGGYLAAGGAGAMNGALDCDLDRLMVRTSKRPVPNGRMTSFQAFWFGVGLCVLAWVILVVWTTVLAALLAMVGVLYYVLIYTRWLKRTSRHNIVVGGGAGSLPPLVGWAAVTGSLSPLALLIAALVFFWTPPHFWSLAIIRREEYAKVGVPMLPVAAGELVTRRSIFRYALVTVCLSLCLVWAPGAALGWGYLLAALLLGGVFVAWAWVAWRRSNPARTWGFYAYTLLYLALLFSAMVLDKALGMTMTMTM
ncbi:MAG: protoheme IX farnesyltransferase [Chloroflexaceae bacterium]|nr:protoheme IX farnesyltransferase [Chloroflexaceae bacterium]